MKRETAEEVIDLKVGSVLRSFVRIMGSEEPGVEEVIRLLKPLFLKPLLKSPEPTHEELEQMRNTAKRMDELILTIAAPAMRTVLKKLPPDKGGRPKVFTPEKAKAACLEMATLLFQGVEKIDASKRVAQRYGVSVWTMNRYWRKYQEANKFRQNVLLSPTMGRTQKQKETKRMRKTNR
jgi:hypothetical protein